MAPVTTTHRTVLAGARVVLPSGVVDGGRLTVEGTRIAAEPPAGADGASAEGRTTVDLSGRGYTIVPGFVDLHNHGGGGASFTSGGAEDILTGVRTHRRHGTTTVVASTVTESLDALSRQAGLLSELVEQGDLAGIHYEGPFISPCRKGAHDEGLLRNPDPADVRKLVEAGRGAVRMVTLAAELPGGIESVRLLADLGVIAAIGHTDGSYEQTREAIDAGATVATHLFNAMPPLQHRQPGPIAALLEDERVTVELINDGVHLHPAVLELAFGSAGAGRVAFITDAMDAAGFGDGMYDLGPMKVEVLEGVARLVEGGSIAGSTLTLDTAFKRAVTVDGLALTDAVQAISVNPARLLGLSDRIGTLEPGKDADLVVLDEAYDLVGVMRKGEWVVEPV
ncbi:N-acetylglucosamine-6-phosphate deacetylase [Actinacidiphila rubida]|uniref:N-acetylglucosamine-6-phosphate deacetylase n=1 Tax=Actinacidiphila rubida TaxID=310780 RepID=A0A1H8DFG5_9ACTN|nr:N-acetylglucosamine-6-phosphate deacetylase [Actinacidiphila rubida]SEN05845.1 N-acetylglucosamine-6-phosphate deacetylase [Actinacidiphila rubida]